MSAVCTTLFAVNLQLGRMASLSSWALAVVATCGAAKESDQGPYYPGPAPPTDVLMQCISSVGLDPPDLQRPGMVYQVLPLGPNSTVTDCASLCCKDWTCAAFTFNLQDNRPGRPRLCPASSRCCSLKTGSLTPINNTYGKYVRSGYKATLRGPDPPFPPSTVFYNNVSFDNQTFDRTEGDTWPTTWLADGSQITAAGDRGDFNSKMSLWHVSGTPDPSLPGGGAGFQTTLIGNLTPVDIATYCRAMNNPAASVKPTSLISVEGSVYWGITCMTYGDEPSFKRQHNYFAFIAKATNASGLSWNFDATIPQFFTGRLAAPMFIQFGKDNALAVDDYVYAHFPYSLDEYTSGSVQSFWNNNDDVLIGRVPKTDVLTRESWQFFIGNGQWSTDDTKAVSIMHYPKMLGMNQVNYHPQSSRYILANYGFIDLNGQPRPWHQSPNVMQHRTQLTLFDSPSPWGPFSLFHRDDDWRSPDGASGGYCPVMPPKWLTSSTAWVVSAQCCAKTTDILRHYNFSVQRFHFSFRT